MEPEVPDGHDAPPPVRRRWPRWAALGLAAALLSAAGAGWFVVHRLNGNIRTDESTAGQLRRYAADRPTPLVDGARNILLLGSDRRGGGAKRTGGRSDATLLLHLGADEHSGAVVSVPRDLMVDIPRCAKPGGGDLEPHFGQVNAAFAEGGAACAIRTVETLTGVRVDHHVVADFEGFKKVVDALGGVRMCVDQPIDDRDAGVRLAAGRQVLSGADALGYVRARHGVGDGSDTERIGRQQRFLSALVDRVSGDDVRHNPARLYPVLDAATSALTTDPGLGSVGALYDLVRTVRRIPGDRLPFVTVPRHPYPRDPARDEPARPAADKLFERLRTDQPLPRGDRAESGDKSDAARQKGAADAGRKGASPEKAGPSSNGACS